MINESKRDDLLLQFLQLLNNNGINVTLGQVKSKLLNKFVVEGNIHNLSLRSNFYLAGVAKYYFQGNLTINKDLSLLKKETWEGQDIQDTWNTNVCSKLDILINVLRNAYIDTIGSEMLEPEDFGEMPLADLFKKYSKQIKKETGTKTPPKKSTIDTNENVGNGYTFEIMYSYEDCQKYNKPTSPGAWCITYGQQHYDSYVRWLDIHYVIFRKNGWENIERPEDPTKLKNWTPEKPQDEYGNSLIALLQSNKSPEPVYITSRWNHGYGNSRCEADHAYTKEEFEQITGVSDADLKRIYDIWKENKGKRSTKNTVDKKEYEQTLRSLKYLQMRINAGENPEKLFIEKNHIYGSTKINKGVFACSAKISETTMETNAKMVYFLFDNNNIQFETVTTTNEAMRLAGNNELVTIKFGEDKNSIFSLKHHKLIKIDGVYQFKRIPDNGELNRLANYGWGYFEVKQGRETGALIDSNTMSPLQLPNGEYWYCRLTSNVSSSFHNENQIHCGIFPNNEHQWFDIIYDVSSMEKFFYNTNKKQFTEIPVPNQTELRYCYDRNAPSEKFVPVLLDMSYGREKAIPNDSVVVYYGTPRQRNGRFAYYGNETTYQIIKEGKPVSVLGQTWFSRILSVYDEYLQVDISLNYRLGHEYIIVTKDLTKVLSIPNIGKYPTEVIDYSDGLLVFCFGPKYSTYSKTVLYDTNTDSFLLNVFNDNSLIFNGYTEYFYTSERRGEGMLVFTKERPIIKQQSPDVQVSYNTIDKKYEIKIYAEELLKLCPREKAKWIDANSNTTIQIDKNDIKEMVNKAISVLLEGFFE